jgi:hypothetical protein
MNMLLSLLQMYRHFRRLGAGQLQAVLQAIRVYREGF